MKQNLATLLILITLFLTYDKLVITTYAQEDSEVELVGYFGGTTEAVFADGNTVYIGQGAQLIVLDVSNPSLDAKDTCGGSTNQHLLCC